MAKADRKPRSSDDTRRVPIVRGAPLVLFAALQVALVAASFSDALKVSGLPDVVDIRATLTWVAVGSAAYLFLIWPMFLFATRRSADRPSWRIALEGACLLALAAPALVAAQSFSNAPVGRVWLVVAYLASLVVLMIALARLARRLPATGRWVLVAVEVLGLGMPLLAYFLADFAAGVGAWAYVSPPLTAAALAGATLTMDSPAGLPAVLGFALIGTIALGFAQYLSPRPTPPPA